MQVALLRGVNLGKRKVIMSELRGLVESAGFSGVRTLVASGNLVLRSKLSGAKLESKLEKLILGGLDLKTDVFVRNADQLDAGHVDVGIEHAHRVGTTADTGYHRIRLASG